MWSPTAAYHESELAIDDATAKYYGAWYEDRQHILAAVWDPAGGLSRIRTLILTCLLGPDVIPWLIARSAGIVHSPPFDPHVHLTHVGTRTMLDGELDMHTHWIAPRLVEMGQALRRLALGLRLHLPGTGIAGLMRSVADYYARNIRGSTMRTGSDEPHERPITARFARLGNSTSRPIVDSAQLTLPRTSTFEVSFDLPWGVSDTGRV